MKAVVINQIQDVVIKEIPRPVPKEDEVLVQVKAAGLCGSDMSIFHGTYPAKYPLVPGHEFSGVICEVGKSVTEWKIGDRVTADPNIYCGNCYYCKRDQENMCENTQALGVTRNGGFAEYVAVPQSQLYSLPDTLTFEQGALVEPLSCVAYAMSRLKPRYGDKAIVLGAGAMGQMLLQALAGGGASHLAAIDMVPERLEQAKALKAKAFFSIEEALKDTPRGYDIVVDATGNVQVIEQMFQLAAKRAKILQFGCADTKATFPISPFQIYDNDWEYIGTRALLLTFQQAIDLLVSGRIVEENIINHKVSLEEIPEILLGARPKNALKIMAIMK